MAQIKAAAVLGRIRFLEEAFGEDGRDQVLAGMKQEHRKIIEAGPHRRSWLDFDLFVDLVRRADEELGKGDGELIRQMGHYTAQANLTTLFRAFYRLGSPGFVIRRSAALWNQNHDTGRFEVEPLGMNHVRCRIVGHEGPPGWELCRSVQGWAVGALELSGARMVEIEDTLCRRDGAKLCEWESRWQ